MNIKFWGVRGSIATPLSNRELNKKIYNAVIAGIERYRSKPDKIPQIVEELPDSIKKTIGGDTACIEIESGEKIIILDAGTGIRRLGLELIERFADKPIEAHILLSHTHWDHISGIPFFSPAYNTENRLTIYGPNPRLEEYLKQQQATEYFPVPLSTTFRFIRLNEEQRFTVGDNVIETMLLNHPGGSYGYRITNGDKSIVYATDSEYKDLSRSAMKPFIDFFHRANILIYDAQYTMTENVEKENWGHSNAFVGIDTALEAEVETLVLTHHEPTYDDEKLWAILKKAQEYLKLNEAEDKLRLVLAYEGLQLKL